MPQLDTTYYTSSVLWFLLCFGSLFCFAQFWLIPKLNKLSSQRKDMISSKLNEIMLLRKELNTLDEQYKHQLDLTSEDVKQINKDIMTSFSREAEEVIKEINKSCEAMIENEEKKMQESFSLLLQDKDQIAKILAKSFLSRTKTLESSEFKH